MSALRAVPLWILAASCAAPVEVREETHWRLDEVSAGEVVMRSGDAQVHPSDAVLVLRARRTDSPARPILVLPAEVSMGEPFFLVIRLPGDAGKARRFRILPGRPGLHLQLDEVDVPAGGSVRVAARASSAGPVSFRTEEIDSP